MLKLKTLIKAISKILCLWLINFSIYAYVVDGLKVHNPDLLKYVREYMPRTGVLKTTSNGFVYVDIDDNYIKQVLKQLRDTNYTLNKGASNIGAHISVMYEDENKNKKFKEYGKKIKFEPLGFYSVVMDDQEYLMLAIDAPELAKIRTKYGLSSKLNNHAFHITLGVKKI